MNFCAFLLVFINFSYLAVLPMVFFKRKGKGNLLWWLTTLPFITSLAGLTVSMLGIMPPVTGYNTLVTEVLSACAVPLSLASITLMSFAIGSHSIPVALWHQNEAPAHIVSWGAYGRIRHPLYASYILMLLAAIVVCPHIVTVLSFALGFTMLNLAARREEERLCVSQFGREYLDYMQRTGRFLPRLTVRTHG